MAEAGSQITADSQVARIFEWRRGFNTIHLIDLGVHLGLFRELVQTPGLTGCWSWWERGYWNLVAVHRITSSPPLCQGYFAGTAPAREPRPAARRLQTPKCQQAGQFQEYFMPGLTRNRPIYPHVLGR